MQDKVKIGLTIDSDITEYLRIEPPHEFTKRLLPILFPNISLEVKEEMLSSIIDFFYDKYTDLISKVFGIGKNYFLAQPEKALKYIKKNYSQVAPFLKAIISQSISSSQKDKVNTLAKQFKEDFKVLYQKVYGISKDSKFQDNVYNRVKSSIQTSGSFTDSHGETVNVGDYVYVLTGQEIFESVQKFLSPNVELQLLEKYPFLSDIVDLSSIDNSQSKLRTIRKKVKDFYEKFLAGDPDIVYLVKYLNSSKYRDPSKSYPITKEALELLLGKLEDLVEMDREKPIEVRQVLGWIVGGSPEYVNMYKDLVYSGVLESDFFTANPANKEDYAFDNTDEALEFLNELKREQEVWVLCGGVSNVTDKRVNVKDTFLVVSYLLVKYDESESQKTAMLRIASALEALKLEKESRILESMFKLTY